MTSTAVRYTQQQPSHLLLFIDKKKKKKNRVGLRVRPLTQKEQLANCTECISFIPNEPQVLVGTDKSFTYDYVFSSETQQHEVYEKAAAPLLEKFVEG